LSALLSVSIVVITLNEAPAIGACLRHVTEVLAREGPGELIVADGGSTDGTAQVAAEHAKTVAAPKGRANGLNAGAAAAAGDVLLFLHADTRLPPGALNVIRSALADPGVVAGRS
jgi:glycosyltransferase involved in cell wall biosynthesis